MHNGKTFAQSQISGFMLTHPKISAEMKYSEAIDFIDSSFVSFQTAGKAAYKEGLDSMKAMLKYLGNPHRNFKVIHVAGTNGKGSVGHILASILQAAGYRTGLFTSPHLHGFRERMRIDGELIPEKAVASFVGEHGGKMKELGLSYFEMTVAMAFDWFSESRIEVAIVEAGLGGRLDATNVVVPELTVITNIALEHTDVLGNTLADIAGEKAGIIKREVPVVIGESDPETDGIFICKAGETDSEIVFADREYSILESAPREGRVRYTVRRSRDGRTQDIDLDLLGGYQAKNIITVRGAVHAIRHFTHLNVSSRALLEGCRDVVQSTGIAGRWQILGSEPLTVCDTGHNAHGMRYLSAQLESCVKEKLYMVIGFSADKDVAGILSYLPSDAYYIFTQAGSPRAMDAGRLASEASLHGFEGETVPGVAAALERARELASPADMIFIGGSNFVVAEIV